MLWRALGALWGALERFGGFSFSRRSGKALGHARERSGTLLGLLWNALGALWGVAERFGGSLSRSGEL